MQQQQLCVCWVLHNLNTPPRASSQSKPSQGPPTLPTTNHHTSASMQVGSGLLLFDECGSLDFEPKTRNFSSPPDRHSVASIAARRRCVWVGIFANSQCSASVTFPVTRRAENLGRLRFGFDSGMCLELSQKASNPDHRQGKSP